MLDLVSPWFKPVRILGCRLDGDASALGGVRIEHFDYVPCRVPEWRVRWDEPSDLGSPPEIPDNAQWKLFPTD